MPVHEKLAQLRVLGGASLVLACLSVTGSADAHEPSACQCEPENGAEEEPFEPAFVLSASVLPRVDGWDREFGHRSGWGLAGGVDLSPWERDTEVHIETTYLTNDRDSLVSFDVGLKVPFHRGTQWDVHAVVGPALAFERMTVTRENGETERENGFVVGTIVGLGVAYWFHRHVGATVDVNYRVLGGEGIAHRLFEALGVAARW